MEKKSTKQFLKENIVIVLLLLIIVIQCYTLVHSRNRLKQMEENASQQKYVGKEQENVEHMVNSIEEALVAGDETKRAEETE